jgi:hypothetical protein
MVSWGGYMDYRNMWLAMWDSLFPDVIEVEKHGALHVPILPSRPYAIVFQ